MAAAAAYSATRAPARNRTSSSKSEIWQKGLGVLRNEAHGTRAVPRTGGINRGCVA